jgi:hypothetical protein
MTRHELFDHLLGWLGDEGIVCTPDSEATSVDFDVSGAGGLWKARILCEDDPAMIQVMCLHPVRVPAGALAEAALLLHQINVTLRIGAFGLDQDTRTLYFRLSMVIQDAPAEPLIATAFGTAGSTFEDHYGPLCTLLAGQPRGRCRLSRPGSGSSAPRKPGLEWPGRRPDLN